MYLVQPRVCLTYLYRRGSIKRESLGARTTMRGVGYCNPYSDALCSALSSQGTSSIECEDIAFSDGEGGYTCGP